MLINSRMSVWESKWDRVIAAATRQSTSSTPTTVAPLLHHTHRYVDVSGLYAHGYQPIQDVSSSSGVSSFVPATLAVWCTNNASLIICAAPAGTLSHGHAPLSMNRVSSYGVLIYNWKRDVFVRHIPTSSVPTSLDISAGGRFLAVGQQGSFVYGMGSLCIFICVLIIK
jgi:hypothetical protein